MSSAVVNFIKLHLFSERVDDLTRQVESLCDELEANKLKHNDNLQRLKSDMEDKVNRLDVF